MTQDNRPSAQSEPAQAQPEHPAGARIFVASMWPVYNFGNHEDRYQAFLQTGKIRFGHLIDSLLLYEKLVLPTQDFMTLTSLVDVLGEAAVNDMLQAGEIEFVRLQGAFGYFGNGSGLVSYRIEGKQSGRSRQPPFMANDEAVSWALSALKTRPAVGLTRAVLEKTVTFLATDVSDAAFDETYRDVIRSPHLSGLFPPGADLKRLPGIKPNVFRCCSMDKPPSEELDHVELLLRLSACNVELKLAELTKCADGTTLRRPSVVRRYRLPMNNGFSMAQVSGLPTQRTTNPKRSDPSYATSWTGQMTLRLQFTTWRTGSLLVSFSRCSLPRTISQKRYTVT